jgi:hypothetical protein
MAAGLLSNKQPAPAQLQDCTGHEKIYIVIDHRHDALAGQQEC